MAFFAQFQAWNVELGISFASGTYTLSSCLFASPSKSPEYFLLLLTALYKDPKAATDFQPLIENVTLRELDIGISCISVPDAPSFVEAGHKATLQLRYLSDFGSPSNNKSFFACADITYVAPSDVPYWVPCLNTTAPDSDPDKGPVPTSTQKPKGRPKPTEEPEPSGDGWSPGEKPVVVRWKPIVGSFGVCFVMVGLGVIYWVRVIRPKRQRLFDEQIEREPAQWVPERG